MRSGGVFFNKLWCSKSGTCLSRRCLLNHLHLSQNSQALLDRTNSEEVQRPVLPYASCSISTAHTHTHTQKGGEGAAGIKISAWSAQLHRHIFRHVVNTEHRIVRVDSTAVLKPFWFCAILHLNVCGGHLSVPYTFMRNRCFAGSMQQLATVPAICGGTKGREHRQVKHRSFRLNLLRFKLWRFQHIRADQCRNSSDLHWIALSTLQPCSRTSLLLGIKQEQLMLCYQFAILHIDKPDRRNLSSHWHPHSARQTFWTVASCRATPWRVACPKTLSLGFGQEIATKSHSKSWTNGGKPTNCCWTKTHELIPPSMKNPMTKERRFPKSQSYHRSGPWTDLHQWGRTNFGPAQTTEPPGHKPLAVNVVVAGSVRRGRGGDQCSQRRS